MIDAYPSTQPVPLGTTVVLVCRVVGVPEEDSPPSYQWICLNGDCTSDIDVSRIQDANSVSVNVLGQNDEGQYSCTVSGVTATYSMSVTSRYSAHTYILVSCSKHKFTSPEFSEPVQ